jgi:hypothetical protein
MCDFEIIEVTLKNGELIKGILVPIFPAKFLLQTDEMCLELSETEIKSLDGEEDFRNSIKFNSVSINREVMIHRYNEDGSMVSLHKMEHVNTSDNILGKVTLVRTSSGGITKEFEELFNQQKYYDSFGNSLPITIEKRLENGWEYSIELPVPVAPGEVYELTIRDAWSRWAEFKDNQWHARHYTGPTSESIYTLIFMFPEKSQILSIDPRPLRQFDFNGKPSVTWKRYMPANERVSFEVVYNL